MRIDLKPIPATIDYTIVYEITRDGNDCLISIEINGYLGSIDFSGAQGEDLWRGTCIELFLCREIGNHYREFNFAPDGRYTVQDLSAYRTNPSPRTFQIAPSVAISRRPSSATMTVHISKPLKDFKYAAVAVITADLRGTRTFWGIDHWDNTPDFHRLENFFPL